jgi:hypothetical protein
VANRTFTQVRGSALSRLQWDRCAHTGLGSLGRFVDRPVDWNALRNLPAQRLDRRLECVHHRLVAQRGGAKIFDRSKRSRQHVDKLMSLESRLVS